MAKTHFLEFTQSWNDINYFGCSHMRCSTSLFREYSIRVRIILYCITTQYDSSFVLLDLFVVCTSSKVNCLTLCLWFLNDLLFTLYFLFLQCWQIYQLVKLSTAAFGYWYRHLYKNFNDSWSCIRDRQCVLACGVVETHVLQFWAFVLFAASRLVLLLSTGSLLTG